MLPVGLHRRNCTGIGLVQRLNVHVTQQKLREAAVIINHNAVGNDFYGAALVTGFHDAEVSLLILDVSHSEDRSQHVVGRCDSLVALPECRYCGVVGHSVVRAVDKPGEAGGVSSLLVVEVDERSAPVGNEHIALLLVKVGVPEERKQRYGAYVCSVLMLVYRAFGNTSHQLVADKADLNSEVELVVALEAYLGINPVVGVVGLYLVLDGVHIHLIGVERTDYRADNDTALHISCPVLVVLSVVLFIADGRFEHSSGLLVLQLDREARLIVIHSVVVALRHQNVVVLCVHDCSQRGYGRGMAVRTFEYIGLRSAHDKDNDKDDDHQQHHRARNEPRQQLSALFLSFQVCTPPHRRVRR